MKVGELFYALGMEWDKQSLKGIKSDLGDLGKFIAKTTAVGVGAGAGVFALVKSFSAVNDELGKTARNRDIAIDTLQSLEYSFKSAGLAGSDVSGVLKNLEDQKAKFARGTADYEAFALLGVNPQKFTDTESMFYSVIDSLKGVKDETVKAELAQRLLGNSNLKPLIDGGSDALKNQKNELKSYGVLLNQTDFKKSAEFNDELLKSTTILKGQLSKVMVELAPVIKDVLSSFNAWIKANKDLIVSGIGSFLTGITDGLKYFGELLGRVSDHLGGFKTIVLAVAGAFALWASPLLLSVGILVAVLALFDDIMSFFKGQPSLLGDFIKSLDGVEKAVLAIVTAFGALKLAMLATRKIGRTLGVAEALGSGAGGKGGKGSMLGKGLKGAGMFALAYEAFDLMDNYAIPALADKISPKRYADPTAYLNAPRDPDAYKADGTSVWATNDTPKQVINHNTIHVNADGQGVGDVVNHLNERGYE